MATRACPSLPDPLIIPATSTPAFFRQAQQQTADDIARRTRQLELDRQEEKSRQRRQIFEQERERLKRELDKALKDAEVAKRAARYSRNEAKSLASERELTEMDQVGGSGTLTRPADTAITLATISFFFALAATFSLLQHTSTTQVMQGLTESMTKELKLKHQRPLPEDAEEVQLERLRRDLERAVLDDEIHQVRGGHITPTAPFADSACSFCIFRAPTRISPILATPLPFFDNP